MTRPELKLVIAELATIRARSPERAEAIARTLRANGWWSHYNLTEAELEYCLKASSTV